MLYSDISAHNHLFTNLLDNTMPLLAEDMRVFGILPSSSDFESMVQASLDKVALWTIFEWSIKRTWSHSFPDIIANQFFGVEVKMTKENKWTSLWNSIFEGLREKDVEKIHIMFWKFWWEKEVRHRLYQDCLSNIAVTHSPRYTIDMELWHADSIFGKMNIEYDDFRWDPKQVQILKDYYKTLWKKWEWLWWIDSDGKDKITSPVIRQYKNMPIEERIDFKISVLVLFPEIFWKKNQTKFEKPCAFLMKEYGAVCPNIRDIFSAWWQKEINYKWNTLRISQVLHMLESSITLVHSKLLELDTNIANEYWWDFSGLKSENWKKLVLETQSNWEVKNWLKDIL